MDEVSLADYLSSQHEAHVDVQRVRQLAGARSRVTYLVDTSAGRFVLRAEQGDVFGTSIGDEFDLMRSLHGVGFPVAEVRWFEPTDDVLAQPFFIMDHIETPATDGDQTASDADALVRTLAHLHGLDPTTASAGRGSVTGRSQRDREVAQRRQVGG